MKKLATYIVLTHLLILTSSGQVTTASDKVTAVASVEKEELTKTETIKWKAETVSERKDFYASKAAFDPAADYEEVYEQSATSGLPKKVESGNIKLMTDNNKAQIAYYNNATVGTILKLTNPTNGKVSYVVVVGKIPPTESKSYLLILSEKAARNLSVKEYSSIELTCYTGI